MTGQRCPQNRWDCPKVSVVIPVGGNRTKDIEKLHVCVRSIAEQDYQRKKLEIILVIDEDNQSVIEHDFGFPVRLVRFVRDPNAFGRDTNARAVAGWDAATGSVLAFTGVSIVWPRDLIKTALSIMYEQKVYAVDGITRVMPNHAESLLGMFQDQALITEFPLYKKDFLLTEETLGQDNRLPSMTSFFITRWWYESVRSAIPQYSESGWEDFDMARAIVERGGSIYCTNRLVAYRNHKLSLRLGKQFLSGISCAKFFENNPQNSYARRRVNQALLVALMTMMAVLVGICFSVAVFPLLSFVIDAVLFGLLMVAVGLLNAKKINNRKAMLFPPLMVIQVLVWILGFVYGGIKGSDCDQEWLQILHQSR